jgi:hypothetical protein
LALGAAVAAVGIEASSLWSFYLRQTRLPLWDMAGHGWGGVELLQRLESGDLLGFLGRLNHQDKWPFGYSLLLLPFQAAGRASFASTTLLSTVLFALIPGLLVWVAWEIEPDGRGLWSGLLAAALFLAAPLPRVLAIVILRETAGAAFSLLALGLYLRARRLETAGAWRSAGLGTLALFWIKYNYGLLWGLTATLCELSRRPFPNLRFPRSPWEISLAAFLGALALGSLAGRNVGVLLYAGLLIATGWLVIRWVLDLKSGDRESLRSWWRSRPPEIRAGLATVVIPLWLWSLSPDPIHPHSIMGFLRNRSTGPPLLSRDSLLFYVRSLVRDDSPSPEVGMAVLVLALIGLLLAVRRSEPWRVLATAAALSGLLVTLHPYKEPRFFATTVPFVFLLATFALHHLTGGRASWLARRGFLALAAMAVLGFLASRSHLDRRLEADYVLYSAPPEIAQPLAAIHAQAPGVARLAVIGTFNQLSENLLRWTLAQDTRTRAVHLVRGPDRLPPHPAPALVATATLEWLAEERPQRILALRVLPDSPFFADADFVSYNAWQLAVIDALPATGSWELESRQFCGLGLELLAFRPTVIREAQTIGHESRSIGSEAQAIRSEARPMGNEAQAIGSARPMVNEAQAIESEARPMENETQAIGSEARPMVNETQAIGSEARPMKNGRRRSGARHARSGTRRKRSRASTPDGERGADDRERGTPDGERDTGDRERGTPDGERGAGDRERGTPDGERGVDDRPGGH